MLCHQLVIGGLSITFFKELIGVNNAFPVRIQVLLWYKVLNQGGAPGTRHRSFSDHTIDLIEKNIDLYVCIEGTLQISAIALNVIPSGNKVYLL